MSAKIQTDEEIAEEAKQVANRRALKQGEWACIDAKCAHINSEKRTSCDVCGKAKPKAKSRVGREIGKDAAEKSKGLFAAEDWVCTKCGNVNWARRSVCNVCNAPKLGDLEMRTGYMDRQDVEYIQRQDDEEFDEFGRKKKKRKLDNEEQKNNENNKTSKSDLDEEEEAEESDEADLDKYDLTAELLNFKVDLAKLKEKYNSYNADNEQPGSAMSSDCSCSCSGGECSCVESEEEIPAPKKTRSERDEETKRKSKTPEKNRNGRSRDRDVKDRRDTEKRDERRSERHSSHERRERDRGSNRSGRERRRSRDVDRQHR